MRKRYRIEDSEKLPVKVLATTSLFVSIVNVIFTHPFDVIKTEVQKVGSKGTMREAIRVLNEKHGPAVFMTGVRI